MASPPLPSQKIYSFTSLLDSSEVRQLFHNYLKQYNNEEPFLFVNSVNEYVLLLSSANRYEKAKTIVSNFINAGCKHEINISHETRMELLQNFSKTSKSDCSRDLFDKVYSRMLVELHLDNFPRFCETEQFLKWAANARREIGEEEFTTRYMEDFQPNQQQPLIKAYSDLRPSMVSKGQKSIPIFEETTLPLSFSQQELGVYSEQDMIHFVRDMMHPLTGVPITKVKSPGTFSKSKRHLSIFTGKDLISYMCRYFAKKDRSEMIRIAMMLVKKQIISSKKDITASNFESSSLYFGFKKKVVIVGVGFAGATIAQELQDDFDVTMIDDNNNWEYNCSFHLLFSNPSKLKEITFSMSKVAKKATVVVGKAKYITPQAVVLESSPMESKIIPFDYLVLSTGCSYRLPFPVEIDPQITKKPAIIIPYSSSSIMNQLSSLTEAKKICIIGGGPVATEVGGEIIAAYPEAQITFLSQGIFLERAMPKAHSYIHKLFSKHSNVKMLFHRKVSKIVNQRIIFTYNDANLHKITESEMEADVIVICVGLQPNTQLLEEYMSDSLNNTRHVIVNEHLQVLKQAENYSVFQQKDIYANELEPISPEEVIGVKVSEEEEDTENDNSHEVEEEDDDAKSTAMADEMFKPQTESSSENLTTFSSSTKNEYYSNIFAAGDIIANKEEKLAYFAKLHGNAVATNLKNLEIYRKPMNKYSKQKYIIQALSLGPKNGIAFRDDRMLFKGRTIPKLKTIFEKTNVKNYKS